ncbi:MAG: tRNA (adenosine(37)-N6)-threonylcarbamoyltransferase complex dimerization subunit type 1 TsaB [Candidatus Omnitrophota bacterium]
MNILAIDTSSKRLCVGLMNNKGRIAGYDLDSGIRHTELLLPTIKKALARAKLSLKQIDYLAVGLGPGSFTGLRIGLATIKGFAAALEKPVVGLPALDILARNALPANGEIVCPVIDARRNLVYSALYKVTPNGLKRRGAYLLVSIEDLLKKIGVRTCVTFLGDGLRMHQQRLKQKLRNSSFLNEGAWYPEAQTLIELAKELIDKGKIGDAGSLRSIYLYPKECQIRRL